MNQVFKSKISWWLFGSVLLLLVGMGGFLLRDGLWVAALTLVFPLALVVWLLLRTRYTITEAELLIVCGPLSWQVPVPQITRVTPTHNPLSSPALSLDRLEIRYGKYDSVLVSPVDKAGFLAALLRLNPAIRHD